MSRQTTDGPGDGGWDDRPRNRWPLVWRAGVTAACLTLVFWLLPTGELVDAVRRVGGLRWTVLLATLSLLQLAAVAKWRLLMGAAGEHCRFLDVLRAHGAGLFANNFLPSLVGGDVVRAGILGRRGVGPEVLLVGGVTDRAADAGALVLIAGMASLFGPAGVEAGVWRILSTASALMVMGLVAGSLLVTRLANTRLPFGLQDVAAKARTAFRAFRSRPVAALAALGISLAIQSSLVVGNIWLGRAMGLSIPVAAWYVVWPLAKLLALVPISLGGLGVRQLAMAGLLAPLAVEAGMAVAQSLVWESLLLGLGVVGGAASVWLPEPKPYSSAAEVAD